jgi:hypothetical protein
LKRESKYLPRTSSLEGESRLNEEYADSAGGFDGSSTTSESVYTEKHDICSIDYSAANNLAAASEDCSSSSHMGNLEAVESSILDLKLKVNCLQNDSDEIGVETKHLSEQIAAEISSG